MKQVMFYVVDTQLGWILGLDGLQKFGVYREVSDTIDRAFPKVSHTAKLEYCELGATTVSGSE